MHNLLKFGAGNAKLPNSTLTFSLPAGHTCPGALTCHSWVPRQPSLTTGKYGIRDGAHALFRCYAAIEELRPSVRDARWHNFDLLHGLSTDDMAQLMHASITLQARSYTERVRWFVSGDCFSPGLRDAIYQVASVSPYVHYFYTKNLPLFLDGSSGLAKTPDNVFITASWGGRFDFLLSDGLFPRTARVVNTYEEAKALDLPIDFNDAYAYATDPTHFCHLVHGQQPAGSVASYEISRRRAAKQFTGYSSTGAGAHHHSSVTL
jgi:hypothetical protein